jgi:peptide/nickel transport system permease protein
VDELMQRLIELVRAFPSIPLWMALSAALPAGWSQTKTYFAVTLILSLIGWTWLARQLRGQVLALRQQIIDGAFTVELYAGQDVWN